MQMAHLLYITHTLSKHQALPSLAHIQIHKPLAEVGTDIQFICASLSLSLILAHDYRQTVLYVVVAMIQTHLYLRGKLNVFDTFLKFRSAFHESSVLNLDNHADKLRLSVCIVNNA